MTTLTVDEAYAAAVELKLTAAEAAARFGVSQCAIKRRNRGRNLLSKGRPGRPCGSNTKHGRSAEAYALVLAGIGLSEAARRIGIGQQALSSYIKRHGLHVPESSVADGKRRKEQARRVQHGLRRQRIEENH